MVIKAEGALDDYLKREERKDKRMFEYVEKYIDSCLKNNRWKICFNSEEYIPDYKSGGYFRFSLCEADQNRLKDLFDKYKENGWHIRMVFPTMLERIACNKKNVYIEFSDKPFD